MVSYSRKRFLFSLALQFTALRSEARKAYDSSRFQSLFSLTLLVSFLGLCLYSYATDSFSAFSFDSFGQGMVTRDYYSV